MTLTATTRRSFGPAGLHNHSSRTLCLNASWRAIVPTRQLPAKMETTVSELKKATKATAEPTRATAHLPGLDIEIVHRRSRDGEAEQISINMQAVPSFEAFGRYVEAANPFAFWAQAAQLVWSPWLDLARTVSLPWGDAPQLPDARAEPGRRSEVKSRSPE